MTEFLFGVLTTLARAATISAVVFFATAMINWNRGFWNESRKHEAISAVLFLVGAGLFLLVGRVWYSQVFAILMGITFLLGRARISNFFYLLKKWRLFRKKNYYKES